jgi:hypothetical protein
VLDIDEKPQAGLFIPPTVIVQTCRSPNSFHAYFRHSSAISSFAFGGGEFFGDGGYVIGAGCKHPTGARYAYSDFCSPSETRIAPLPDSTLEALWKMRRASLESPESEGSEASKYIFLATGDEPFPFFRMAQCENVAFAIMEKCGRRVTRLGKAFRCPLPSCPDNHPSVALWKSEIGNGIIGLRHFHGDPSFLLLPEVYAACVSGEVRRLQSGEVAVWWLRALVETGLIELPPINAPVLSADAPPSARKLYDGFVRLLRIRELYKAGQTSAPFSWRFAASWCGIGSLATVQTAMAWLLANGCLRKVPTPGGSRALSVFKLGSVYRLARR